MFSKMFSKFQGFTPTTWLAVGLLIVLFALLSIAGKKVKWNARMLAQASLCLALAFLLSYVRLYKMPQGGSVTAASILPIALFAYLYGPLPGCIMSVTYGFLQLIQDPYVIHPVQMLLDYPIAFGVIALASLPRLVMKDDAIISPLVVGVLLGGFARMLMSTLSGVVFFYESAGEQNVFIYSFVYNFTSIGVDTLLCAVIAALPWSRSFVKRLETQGRTIRASYNA